MSPDTKDGLEILCRCARIFPFLTFIGMLVFGNSVLDKNMPYYRLYNTGNNWWNQVVILIFSTVTVGFYIFTAIQFLNHVMYLNSVYLWQEKIQQRWYSSILFNRLITRTK
jgi:hypothetical protein